MNIQNIAKNITGKDCLTVITLDMQLYDMAMKLWCSVEDVSNSFLFRPGELHILMWALACIGDYIEGSGIDQAWIEAGMYSATTVIKQVLEGKHLYRSLECHSITIISMYTLFFQQFLKKFLNEHQLVVELSNTLKDAYENDVNSETPEDLVKIINEDAVWFDRLIGVTSKIAIYKKDMNPILTFLFNYIKQFETILLFIRATRDQDIDLHLAATESLLKYYFAHDHLNYARLLPMYLASMQNVKANHLDLWREFELGNFGVTKSNVKFTSIGPIMELNKKIEK